MKALTFTLLALLAVACTDARYENSMSNRPSTEVGDNSKVYTISCEGPKGWTDFQTKRHPSNCYGGRSGIWSFLTVEGKSVWKTNCSVENEAE
jgi:hypothetical protein